MTFIEDFEVIWISPELTEFFGLPDVSPELPDVASVLPIDIENGGTPCGFCMDFDDWKPEHCKKCSWLDQFRVQEN